MDSYNWIIFGGFFSFFEYGKTVLGITHDDRQFLAYHRAFFGSSIPLFAGGCKQSIRKFGGRLCRRRIIFGSSATIAEER